MNAKKKILVLIIFIVFIALCVLLFSDRVESDGNIVFKTIQEMDTRILLAINPDGDVIFLNVFFLFITTYLDIAVPITVAILFILSFYVEKLKKYQFILMVTLLSFLVNALATNYLKDGFSRARPQAIPPGSDYYFGHINPLQTIKGHTSFPSGHTSSAFSLMIPLIIYMKPKWLKVSFLTYACLQGMSRMWVGVHFPADVLMGAILGILMGSVMYHVIQTVIDRTTPEDLRLNKIN